MGRTESETLLLGSLPIVLCGLAVNDSRVKALKKIISAIVPQCVQIQSDIESLNAIDIMPKRDCDKNRLSLSPLQLAAGTILFIDETGLQEGTLNDTGSHSLGALSSVVTAQQLPYRYPFSVIKVPTDLPIIILTSSAGGNSLCGSGVGLKVTLKRPVLGLEGSKVPFQDGPVGESKADNKTVDNMVREINSSNVSRVGDDNYVKMIVDVRTWWATVRLMDVSMSEAVAMNGVDEFANARQKNSRLTQADFHWWITVSRLLAISEGTSFRPFEFLYYTLIISGKLSN